MPRVRHPSQEIEKALQHIEALRWRVHVGSSHAWGKIYCPFNDKQCRYGRFGVASVFSTPRNSGNHAKLIRRIADNCIGKIK